MAALTVPLTALFRDHDNWAVFINNNGKAEKRVIKVGAKNTFAAEVLTGLSNNDQVVLHPDSRIADGIAIISRDKLN